MTVIKSVATFAIGLLATVFCLPGDARDMTKTDPIPDTAKRHSTGPEYDATGNLKLPKDFKTWVFVGSSLGLDYQPAVAVNTSREKKAYEAAPIGDFHNVYINPEAYDHYLETGKFPDKTVLVMDVFQARDKEPKNIVQGGHFPGTHRAVEVAVKNSNRPDGSKTDWAYYAFPDGRKATTAKAFKDATCYDCHKKHADDDNVWVQFYPTLRDFKKAGGR